MPPESLPWDRKEFVVKDRKHDRAAGSDTLGGVGGSVSGGSSSTPRWRDLYHGPRDFPRASPRRPPPGLDKQSGGYHQIYPQESSGHGCTPTRSGDRFWLEDESFRPPSGRYSRGWSSSSSGSRESRGSFRRSPYGDSGDFSRQHHEPPVTARSVALPITPLSSQLPLKYQNDKNGGVVDDGLGTGHRYDRDGDHSLGLISWKALKWTRPGSLSSPKTARSESDEAGLELSVPPGKDTPIRSLTASPLPSDDGLPRKKPRLGWGQGLAKYEKQKVEGSVDASGQNHSGNSTKDLISETSPKVMGVAGSMSPVTPCSAACISSPGVVDDRHCFKATNVDNDPRHYSDSSALGPQNCSEEFSIKLDHLPPTSILTSLLTDFLQPEDSCSGDSTFPKNAATNKLLLFRTCISKELEKTECEIDLFENELKSLSSEGDGASKAPLNSTSLEDYVQVASPVTFVAEPILDTKSLEECDAVVKNADSNIPLTASSNIGKSASSGKEISDIDLKSAGRPGTVENDGLQVPEASQSNPPDGGMRKTILHGPGDWDFLYTKSSYANFDMGSREQTYRNLLSLIMASNRDAAKKASQVFDKAFPADLPQFDIWGSNKILSYRSDDMHIMEKLASHKRLLKFKERVLTLKFRAFHHLWKEDLRLLSIRKQRPKSQKRFELSSHLSQNGSQKHRSSIRSRFTLPAGNLTLFPTTEIVDFTSKLLSDSHIKPCRNNLKMPMLILDEKERMHSRFVTSNSLVEDPCSLERERAMINPWAQGEKEVFMEMLATFGKDFAKISSFLDHKTTADCIEFYYKNHKSESFKDVRRRLGIRKQWRCLPTNTYLVTSGKKWNREANVASLDMLGEVSVAAAQISGNTRNQQRHAGRSIDKLKVYRVGYGSLERGNSAEMSGYEKETTAADVLAGICGTLSSEAVSSCVTSSIDPPEKMNYVARDQPFTPEVILNIHEEDTCSDEGCGELESVDWTDEEKSIFIRALSMYGKDFARISRCVGTRSREQCKIFFSKARKCLGLDVIYSGAGSMGTPASDTNGGRSDTDDACPAEMDSAICSTHSCSKMDTDFTQSVANASREGFVQGGNTPLQTETDRSSEQYEVGGSNQEEIKGKLSRLAPVLNDDKLVNQGENFRSCEFLKEISGAAALGCNEPKRFHQGGELSVDTETEKGGHVVSPVEPATMTCIKVEELKSQTAAEVQQKVTGGSSPADGLKSEVDSQQFLEVPGTGFGNRQQKMDMDENSSVSLCLAPDSNANRNTSHSTNEMNAGPSLTFATCYQQQIPPELLPSMQEKSQVASLKQERSLSEPLNSVLPDPSSISSDEPLRIPSKSTLNFEEHRNKRHWDSAAIEVYKQYLMGNQSLNRIDQPLNILRGYPLQMLNQKGLKRHTNLIGENQLLLESHSIGNAISQLSPQFVPDIHNEKSSRSGFSNSKPGTLISPKSENPSDAQLRSCSQMSHSEPGESSHRTGDVKLFGQILSNPSSLQKSNSSSHLQESNRQPLSLKQKNRSATMKPSNSKKANSMLASTSESSGHLGQEEVPLRSYGFWDGNRIQTGFSSLPESAVLLSKYRGAMPFYSAKDGVASSNGVLAEYQQQAYVQPLSADGKWLDSFPELQKRNGFEMVSGFQSQPGRTALLGANMVGGGGILVGGGGVSDPVAALKLHYATATGRAKVLSSEVESSSRGET